MLLKCCTQYASKFGKLGSGHRTGKSFQFIPKERQCQIILKLWFNWYHFTCQQDNTQNPSSQASGVRDLKTSRCISWIQNGRGTRDQIANIRWIIEKAREFQKNIYFCFIDYTKAFDCVDHTNCRRLLKQWEYQTTLTAS